MKKLLSHFLPQIVAIAIITVAGIFLFKFFREKVYFPVTVSIEMKSPKDNVCQLFYSTFDRYYQNHTLSEAYAGGEHRTASRLRSITGCASIS